MATFRCGEIMKERLVAFKESEEWAKLSQQSSAELLPEFGVSASKLLHTSLKGEASRVTPTPQGR